MTETIRELGKNTPFVVTVGTAVTIIAFVMGAAGVAYKAKIDIERDNARRDSDIRLLIERVDSLKETLQQIRADVRGLGGKP
jgi:hypothetical protein